LSFIEGLSLVQNVLRMPDRHDWMDGWMDDWRNEGWILELFPGSSEARDSSLA
jgi:hypothetical protein